MKSCSLYLGEKGSIGTTDVTAHYPFTICVKVIDQIRNAIISQQPLRQPFLDLFIAIHNDDGSFPSHLKDSTPVIDQIPNQTKIQQFRSNPPTDADVVNYFIHAFPDVYLVCAGGKEEWGSTLGGRAEANMEYISIASDLVFLLNQTVNGIRDGVSATRIMFMFMSVVLHEIGHSIIIWYGGRACDSLQLGGIGREAGNFIEKRFWGGISAAEFPAGEEGNILRLEDIGLMKNGNFFPVDDRLASHVLKLDISNGLPLIDISNLLPAPPIDFSSGRTRSKLLNVLYPSKSVIAPKSNKTRRPILGHDKIRVMPSDSFLRTHGLA